MFSEKDLVETCQLEPVRFSSPGNSGLWHWTRFGIGQGLTHGVTPAKGAVHSANTPVGPLIFTCCRLIGVFYRPFLCRVMLCHAVPCYAVQPVFLAEASQLLSQAREETTALSQAVTSAQVGLVEPTQDARH